MSLNGAPVALRQFEAVQEFLPLLSVLPEVKLKRSIIYMIKNNFTTGLHLYDSNDNERILIQSFGCCL